MAETSDEDIFIKEQEKPAKQRKRAPRSMTEETKERMALILAKGRETRLKNNELKRQAMKEDKELIKETIKTRLKEVKKQLKEELVSASMVKQKKTVKSVQTPEPETKPEPEFIDPEPARKKPEPAVQVQAPAVQAPAPAVQAPAPAVQAPAPISVKAPAKPSIPAPTPIQVQAPKPSTTAEYMRKLRSAYHF